MSQTINRQIRTSRLNRDLGIVIGLLLTDGCITGIKTHKWKIIFTNKSEVLQNFFKNKFTNIFGAVNFIEIPRENGVTNIEVNSKRIVTNLLNFTPTFRTRQFEDGTFPPAKIPEFFEELPQKDVCKILQAMFSADGTVVISVKWNKRDRKWELGRRVKLASKHPKLKEQIANLLRKLNFHPTIHSDGVALQRKEDLIRFQKEIRFIDGVKVTKNKIWGGFNKNDILDLLVKTFSIKQNEINKFKSKEEIINFLKSLM